MSIYSMLCCTDCKVSLWLGKAVFTDQLATKVARFHVGPEDAVLNHNNMPLTMALWKMLADHHGHTIRTLFDYEYESLPDMSLYREIGGDCEGDISFEDYLGDT